MLAALVFGPPDGRIIGPAAGGKLAKKYGFRPAWLGAFGAEIIKSLVLMKFPEVFRVTFGRNRSNVVVTSSWISWVPDALSSINTTLASDSPLEGAGFEPVWGFSCQVVVLVFVGFFVRSGKAVLRPVACDQVCVARGRGQGTETVAKLGGRLAALVFRSALRPEHAQRR
jgi:hypothetical protein